MKELGGLKGAIANRAEATFAALPADVQTALPKVLRALVTVSRSGAEPTARAVAMARFAEASPEWRIVEAFLDPQVRLLVADGDGDGARFRLAHEALITHWQRAKRQIAQDRDDLRTRAVVEEAEAEWRNADARHRRGYLLRDPHLANAVDLAKRWGDELDAPLRDLIRRSGRRARLAQTLTVLAALVCAVIASVAVYFGQQSARNQTKAENQHQRTEVMFGIAEELLEGTAAIPRLGPCLTHTEKLESLSPPAGSQNFFVGRWHVLQDQGSTDMDWYANGTCVFRNIFQGWTLIGQKYLPHTCTWSFQRISDHVFQN